MITQEATIMNFVVLKPKNGSRYCFKKLVASSVKKPITVNTLPIAQ